MMRRWRAPVGRPLRMGLRDKSPVAMLAVAMAICSCSNGGPSVPAAPPDAPTSTERIEQARRNAAEFGGAWEMESLEHVSSREGEWDLKGPDAQWAWASGRWILHPPRQFARQLLGDTLYEFCAEQLRGEVWHCQIRINSCVWLTMYASGNVQLDLSATNCRERLQPTVAHLGDYDPEVSAWEVPLPGPASESGPESLP